MLALGRSVYRALGGAGGELEAALIYSNVVFGGNVLLWLMSGLAAVIRGTGNMIVPAAVICAGVIFLVPVSPLLIFGFGPIPALGIAGGGVALLLFYTAGSAVLAWYILSGRNPARFRWCRLRWPLFRDILRVGAISGIQSIQTNFTIAFATALVAGTDDVNAIVGFGTGVRLEYLLMPVVLGIGAPLVSLVGTNIGAGQQQRALRIALTGGALAFALTEIIGLAAAIWPERWLTLFSAEPGMIMVGSAYLRIVGPAYGFFGLGLSLYLASQGAGRLFWPLFYGFIRVFIAVVGGWAALRLTGSLNWMFAALALGLVVYGVAVAAAIRSGAWFRSSRADAH
jgi:Na+-driven multidrug efflux pump